MIHNLLQQVPQILLYYVHQKMFLRENYDFKKHPENQVFTYHVHIFCSFNIMNL